MTELLQAHPVATLLIDGGGRVIDANTAAEHLLNRGQAAMRDRCARDLLYWRDGGGIDRMLAEPAKAMWAYSIELELSGGGRIAADVALGAINPAEGWRMLAIHPVPRGGRMPFRRPGTGARSASAAAAMLAHEIKNPLSGIRGAAQLLGKPATSASASDELSALICREVDRIASLIDGMQGFSRDTPLRCAPLNIYEAIEQARAVAVQGFGVTVPIDEEFDPSLPRVRGNHDALVQVLINLIKNACEALAGQERPHIRLRTAYRHGLSLDTGDGRGQQPLPVAIIVEDNGPGVPDAFIDDLFDPFVTSKRDGQGLGLALVDKLVRDMGGMVEHSRADGRTRFSVHLGVARAAAEDPWS